MMQKSSYYLQGTTDFKSFKLSEYENKDLWHLMVRLCTKINGCSVEEMVGLIQASIPCKNLIRPIIIVSHSPIHYLYDQSIDFMT